MKFYPTLEETLYNRFTDDDEIRDISNHGALTGVPGFTYNTEINSFFNEYEDEIEDWLYEWMGDNWMEESAIGSQPTFQDSRNLAVWIVVEFWCGLKADELDYDGYDNLALKSLESAV